MGVSGSIRKITFDGTTFNVPADANFSEMGSKFENDMIPTSGQGLSKMTKRIQKVEGVVVIVDSIEREILKNLADQIDDFPMSYETADGTSRSTVGKINFDARETEENRASLTILPRDEWQTFTN